MTVFVVRFTDGDCCYVIGVYSSRENAEAALQHDADRHGDAPYCYRIVEHTLDAEAT